VIHMYLAIRLKLRAKEARPIPYAYEQTIQASVASRFMLQTGLVIFVFLLFHLAHFTFCWIGTATIFEGGQPKQVSYLNLHDPQDPAKRHDVYAMTVLGFMNPVISLLYIAAQVFLLLHLWHGVGSVFQTLGANSPRWQTTIRLFGWAVALIVGVGNIAIVVAVWAGAVPLPPYIQLR
jgi:succinate dehydrogenase / fumarate reductase cytochrome b subunit